MGEKKQKRRTPKMLFIKITLFAAAVVGLFTDVSPLLGVEHGVDKKMWLTRLSGFGGPPRNVLINLGVLPGGRHVIENKSGEVLFVLPNFDSDYIGMLRADERMMVYLKSIDQVSLIANFKFDKQLADKVKSKYNK